MRVSTVKTAVSVASVKTAIRAVLQMGPAPASPVITAQRVICRVPRIATVPTAITPANVFGPTPIHVTGLMAHVTAGTVTLELTVKVCVLRDPTDATAMEIALARMVLCVIT